jgi:major inositol transporter-like SP family MFS transporter
MRWRVWGSSSGKAQLRATHGGHGGAAPAHVLDPHKRFLIRLTIISTLGCLLFGYDTGVISGSLLYMRDDLELTLMTEGAVVSSLLLGAIIGTLVGGKIADVLAQGRGERQR